MVHLFHLVNESTASRLETSMAVNPERKKGVVGAFMKLQWIIFGVVGLVVLWLFSRMQQSPEPQVVAEFIGSPEVESGASQADAQTRLGVFQTLASLAQSANEAILQRFGVEAQLEATRLGIAADRELSLRQIDAQEGLYLEDLRNRVEQERLHARAVTDFVREHRGKISTDSSTVIFNALSSAFGRQQVPFTPERAKWYTPITQGLGRLVGRLSIPGLGG